MELSQIWCYPVKSCAGISLDLASVTARGLALDRHWMLVDPDGRFVTQRQSPRMALIRPSLVEGGLKIEAPEHSKLEIGEDESDGRTDSVRVWKDDCNAALVSEKADAWFSSFLDRPVRLVFLPAAQHRQVDPEYGSEGDEVGFADGFPFLLIGEASLDDLSRRLGTALDMRRFRPNLVVSGSEAYAEDTWSKMRIGEVPFQVVKPCSRCVITTVNPDLGERDLDTLGALRAYRKRGSRVFFGQNLIQRELGNLSVGDEVTLIG